MNIHMIAVFAGMVSTIIFMTSYIPMLARAFRTKDLHSYSLAHLALGNLGNGIHWLYVAHLPFGPIWFLHSFYTLASALMLLWYIQYTYKTVRNQQRRSASSRRLFWRSFSAILPRKSRASTLDRANRNAHSGRHQQPGTV